MNYIKKNGKIVATSNPSEVTVDNFVVEPGGEARVWCKLEMYEYDRITGEKKTIRNQIMGENPGDFDMMAPIWKREGMTITMLHDPRGEMKATGVEANLEILNKRLKEEEEAKAEAEAEAKAKAEVEAEEERKAMEEAKAEAEAEAKAKAMAEAEEERKAMEEAKAETEVAAKGAETAFKGGKPVEPQPSFEEAQGETVTKAVKPKKESK